MGADYAHPLALPCLKKFHDFAPEIYKLQYQQFSTVYSSKPSVELGNLTLASISSSSLWWTVTTLSHPGLYTTTESKWLLASVSERKSNDILRWYSMVSIKNPVLFFHKKSLLIDLVYLKVWEPQCMKSRNSIYFLNVSIKQPVLSQFQILEALNDQVL